MRTENIHKYEFSVWIPSPEALATIWPYLHPYIGNQAKLVAQHLLQRVHTLNPCTVTLLLPSERTLSVASDRVERAGCLLKSLYTQKTTGAYMPIFAHVRSYAMQKIAQHSWLQYNRLGRIWYGHSKPNVTKSYSTYIPYIPLSTWSESEPRCHRSSRHSSNTRAAVLCTPAGSSSVALS